MFIEHGEHDFLSETEIQDMVSDVSVSTIDYEINNDNLEQDVQKALGVENLTQCIRCSVHTFQLCVEHGLKTSSVNKLLFKARKVSKLL